MKKVFWFMVGFCLVFSVGMAHAQTWYNVNQFTCSWDIVTTDVDGDPLPVDGVLHYRLFLANADTDPTKTNPVQVSDTTDLTATITVGVKGRYYIGIKAVWIYTDNSELESAINWADEIVYQETVGIWAIRHHVSPHPPKELEKQ